MSSDLPLSSDDGPLLTAWERYKQRRDKEAKVVSPLKREWNWGREGFYGEEGVMIKEDHLLWYLHSYNPHGDMGASEQSFEQFLECGPAYEIGEEVLDELYEVVKTLRQ